MNSFMVSCSIDPVRKSNDGTMVAIRESAPMVMAMGFMDSFFKAQIFAARAGCMIFESTM